MVCQLAILHTSITTTASVLSEELAKTSNSQARLSLVNQVLVINIGELPLRGALEVYSNAFNELLANEQTYGKDID